MLPIALGAWSRRCWPTCSCITRSICGWLGSTPNIRFERYAVVVHCVTERQARNLVAAIGDRMEAVGLRLHPDKTKVVYCQDGNRRLDYGLTAFTFLGFTFRARAARTKHGTMFVCSSRPSARTPKTRSAVRFADGGCTAGSG